MNGRSVFMEGNSKYQQWLDSFEKIKDVPKQTFITSMNLFLNLKGCGFEDWEELVKEKIGEDLFSFLSGLCFYDYKVTSSICDWVLEFNEADFVKVLTSFLEIPSLLSSETKYPEKIFNILFIVERALAQNKVYCYYRCLPFLDSNHESSHLLMNFDVVLKNIENYDGKSPNDFLVYFSIMSEEEFEQYFKEEYLNIIPHASTRSLLLYLEGTIHKEEILKTVEFNKAFSNQSFDHQLDILTILENQECNTDLIRNLRKKIKKTHQYHTGSDIIHHYFEMNLEKFRRIHQEILTSSYLLEGNFHPKYGLLISFLRELGQSDFTSSFQNRNLYQTYTEEYWYHLLESLYSDVVKYSKKSIVQNLFDISKLPHFINEVNDDINYNILINTNETGNNASFDPTPHQIMDRFGILTPKNFSHTIYQRFIYGYYQDITEDRILSINPQPVELDPDITKKKDIGVSPLHSRSRNYWLSMKQFNDIAYQNNIYGSIFIKTKKEDGTFIQPNCLISIGDELTRLEEKEAEQKNIKILRLKRQKDTNIACEGPPSHHYG